MGMFGTNIGPDIKIGGGDNGLLGQVGEAIQRPLKSLFGGDEPSFNAPPPSQQLQDALAAHQKELSVSPEIRQQRYLEGVNKASQDIGFDPTSQALSGRAQRIFQRSAGGLTRQAQLQGLTQNLSGMGKAVDYQQQLLNFKRGIDSKAQEFQLQAEATRNQVIGQIFQGIGAGIGGYMGMQAGKSNAMPSASPGSSWSSSPPIGTFQGGFSSYSSPYFGHIGG